MSELDFRIAGDRGVLITFGREVTRETLQRVLSFAKTLEKSDIPGVVETNWGPCTLLILYDPRQVDYATLMDRVRKIEEKRPTHRRFAQERKIIEIPAVYGGRYGPDLPLVAELLNISEEEVIQRHVSNDYLIYFTGFIGGSAHFKGNDRLFQLPRKKTPAIFYPAGSLLFADGLGVALKGADGPTGWYSIGLSPLRQWYPHKDPPVLIKSGDRIRYRRIDEDEFHRIKRELDEDRYTLKYL